MVFSAAACPLLVCAFMIEGGALLLHTEVTAGEQVKNNLTSFCLYVVTHDPIKNTSKKNVKKTFGKIHFKATDSE